MEERALSGEIGDLDQHQDQQQVSHPKQRRGEPGGRLPRLKNQKKGEQDGQQDETGLSFEKGEERRRSQRDDHLPGGECGHQSVNAPDGERQQGEGEEGDQKGSHGWKVYTNPSGWGRGRPLLAGGASVRYSRAMTITYIHHSSFSVEAVNCTILFDYVKGPLPEFRTDKPIYVLCSHRHSDHYSDRIFRLSDQYDEVYYLLSYDIDNNKRVPPRLRKVTTFIHPGQELTLARFSLRALESTDEGVAFICKVGGKTVYHAGDLNDWYWIGEDEEENKAMQRAYRKEVEKMDPHFNIAFLPVDPRLETTYSLGVKELLSHTTVDHLFPMHFWDDYSVCSKLEQELGRPVEQITRKGQRFEID